MSKRENNPIAPDKNALMHSREKVNSELGEVLTLKEMMFVNQLFTMDCMMDPAKAAVRAGLKPKYAKEQLMRKPNVRMEIEKRLARMQHSVQCSPDAVRDKMWEEANNHMAEDSSPTARVTALKTLMQMYNLIGPKDRGQENRSSITVDIRIGPGTQVSIGSDERNEMITVNEEGL